MRDKEEIMKTRFAKLLCLLICVIGMFGVSFVFEANAEESINFEGIITDSQGYNDYYINQNRWLIGDEDTVKTANYDGKEKDYLRFMECGKRSFFGPRSKYEDFVCRFTVIMNEIDSPDGASLGLSFGRKQLYSMVDECNGFVFMKSNEGTAVRATQGTLDRADVGSIWLQYQAENAVDLWETAGASYDVMVIKSGDRAYLYYAAAGDESGMNILRATISGVSGEGYVAVCGLMEATFRLDEFSVVSLDEGAVSASAFGYKGAAAYCGTQSVLGHGGEAGISAGWKDFSFSFGAKLIAGSGFAVKLGNATVWLHADGTLAAQGMKKTEEGTKIDWTLPAINLRIRLVGGMLWVEAKGNNGYDVCGIFEYTEVSAPVQIVLLAGADTSVVVDSVSLVSMEPKIEIEKHDYDPVADIDPIHEKDMSFNEYYGR